MDLIEYRKDYQESLEIFLSIMYDIMEYKFTNEGKKSDLKNTCHICINSGGGFWLILNEKEVVGTVGLKVIDFINGIGEIKRLFLLPEYQGHGFGKMLLLNAINVAKENGLTYLRLYTTLKSQKALSLYRSVGFYEIKSYADSKVAQVYMELKLK